MNGLGRAGAAAVARAAKAIAGHRLQLLDELPGVAEVTPRELQFMWEVWWIVCGIQ